MKVFGDKGLVEDSLKENTQMATELGTGQYEISLECLFLRMGVMMDLLNSLLSMVSLKRLGKMDEYSDVIFEMIKS